MGLTDHARATSIIANSFLEVAETYVADGRDDLATVALAIAKGYNMAARRMDAAVREDARAYAEAGRCSVDHTTLKAAKCPVCGDPRG